MASILKHAKCNGSLYPDLSGRFSFLTPSMSVLPDGVVFGTMEIKENKEDNSLIFSCGKCGAKLNPANDAKVIIHQCMFCRKNRPIDSIWVSHPFYSVCESCKEILLGEKEAESGELKETMSYFLIPKSSIKFVLMSDILSKSVV